jgi:hypothetical protein
LAVHFILIIEEENNFYYKNKGMFSILYLLIVFLALFLILNYLTIEKYEDLGINYFGIFPKENHSKRMRNLIYHNDPIFLEYNKRFVKLNTSSVNPTNVGTLEEVLENIIYIVPKKLKQGLSPVEYNSNVFLKSIVLGTPSKHPIEKKELLIIPYVRPENNQQPYLEIGDYVNLKTIGNEFLTINPTDNTIEFVNSKDVPNNGIFRITNSPQCYKNYKNYGLDNRNTSITTLKILMNEIRETLEKEKEKMSSDQNKIREYKKKLVDLEDEVYKLENSVDINEGVLESVRRNYETELSNLRDSLESKKFELKREVESKKQLAQSVFDEKYIKDMKDLVSLGC